MIYPLVRLVRQLRHTALIRWLRVRGHAVDATARIASGVVLQRGVSPQSAPGTIEVGARCELDRGVVLHAWGGQIRLAPRVVLGPYAVVYGHGGVEIGEASLISMHCRILSSNHGVPPPGVEIRSQPDVRLPTRIGKDVWLGAGVTVLGGVTIGDGCVVGAGAVVAHDLPPYTVSVGIPARVIRQRT